MFNNSCDTNILRYMWTKLWQLISHLWRCFENCSAFLPNWFDAKAQWVIGCFWSLFWPILPNWFSGWWQYISGAGRALMDDGRDEIGEGAQPPPTIYQGLPSRLAGTTPKHSNGPQDFTQAHHNLNGSKVFFQESPASHKVVGESTSCFLHS